MGTKKKKRPEPTLSNVSGTKEEISLSFCNMVKSIKCPSCGVNFSDAAIDWGDAWHEGRRDAMKDMEVTERDGPYKVKCELCEKKSWICYFSETAKLEENE